MIKMVRGYSPPPQDAGMDYAGYGFGNFALSTERQQPGTSPSVAATSEFYGPRLRESRALARPVPALNGFGSCGCGGGSPRYGAADTNPLGALGPVFVLGGLWALYSLVK
jgi:hypothetical protein